MNVKQVSETLGVSAGKVAAKKEKLTELYRHFDEVGNLLYVGISASTISRFTQHKSGSGWSWKVAKITIERYATRQEAEQAETHAIVLEKPLHNKAKTGIKPEKLKSVNFSKYLTPPTEKVDLEKLFAKMGIKVRKA